MLIFDQLNKADRHLRMLSWIVAAGILILLTGLWWVQVVRSHQFVEDQRIQSYRTVRVPAPRGKITDRNGMVLAENQPVYSISLYLGDRVWRENVREEYRRAEAAARQQGAAVRKPNLVEHIASWFGYKPSLVQLRRLEKTETQKIGREARYSVTSNIVAQLSQVLGEQLTLNETNFHKHYQQRLVLPLSIRNKLDAVQIARLQERGLNLPGVDMEVQPTRFYPQHTLAAHVLGSLVHSDESAEGDLDSYSYWLPDYRGLSGIEASFDRELRGRAGAKSVLVNNLGYRQSETVLAPIEAGKDLTLTIDAEIQRTAEHALANAPFATPPARGAAVVLDVRTGEVLALASSPTFDPNDWIPFLPYAIANNYTNESTAPLRNRAVYGNYFPGSTFKIMVALAGLEAGTLDTNETIHVEANPRDWAHGIYYVGPSRHPFKDTAPPGDYKFRLAFIKSSNGYFIEEGLRATPERIVAMAQQFHFGEHTGIELPDSRGLLPTSAWVRRNRGGWSSVAKGNLSIGQGDLDVTPLQVAVAVAAVANGGQVLTPQLVMKTRGPDELVASDPPSSLQPIVRDQVSVSSRSLDIVRQAMLADVQDPAGTAFNAFHARDRKTPLLKDFLVCGKTGTAQVEKGNNLDHYTVWFASYAPYENPRYVVVVMVDGEKPGSGVSGGNTCAPIAMQIYEKLKYREQKLPSARGNSYVRN